MMAPGFRLRLGRPSRRWPMPGITESSTVEWHSAQVMPTRTRVSLPSLETTVPLTPTTALSFSSAIVVAGLFRSAVFRIPGGSASASTLRPTESAVVGSTAFAIVSCRRRVSVQNGSFPNVSKRKMSFPLEGRGVSCAATQNAVLASATPTTLHTLRPSHLASGLATLFAICSPVQRYSPADRLPGGRRNPCHARRDAISLS